MEILRSVARDRLHRLSARAGLAALLLLGLGLVPAGAPAQTVKVPTFIAADVGGTFRQSTLETADVAVGRDGSAMFAWDDVSHAMPPYVTSWGTRRFSQARTALGGATLAAGATLQDQQLRIAARVLPKLAGDFPSLLYFPYAVAIRNHGPSQGRVLDFLVTVSPYFLLAIGSTADLGRGAVVAMKATDAPVFVTWDSSVGGLVGVDVFAPSWTITPTDPEPFIDIAPLADGGYVVAWGANVGSRPPAEGMRFDVAAVPGRDDYAQH